MIPELRGLSYEKRLKGCGSTTLETSRSRDQIEVFKILNGYENIDRTILFSFKKNSRTRGHEVTLVKDQCRLDIRKYSFSERTTNEWNKLSIDCVTASSVNMFKNKVNTSQEGGLHVDEKYGFLVHLPSGPLPWMAILFNLAKFARGGVAGSGRWIPKIVRS